MHTLLEAMNVWHCPSCMMHANECAMSTRRLLGPGVSMVQCSIRNPLVCETRTSTTDDELHKHTMSWVSWACWCFPRPCCDTALLRCSSELQYNTSLLIRLNRQRPHLANALKHFKGPRKTQVSLQLSNYSLTTLLKPSVI